MLPLSKCIFWSAEQQAILLLAFESGLITYKKQDVYNNERRFISAMQLLVKKGVFEKTNSDYPEYKIAYSGKWLIRNNIFPLDLRE